MVLEFGLEDSWTAIDNLHGLMNLHGAPIMRMFCLFLNSDLPLQKIKNTFIGLYCVLGHLEHFIKKIFFRVPPSSEKSRFSHFWSTYKQKKVECLLISRNKQISRLCDPCLKSDPQDILGKIYLFNTNQKQSSDSQTHIIHCNDPLVMYNNTMWLLVTTLYILTVLTTIWLYTVYSKWLILCYD